MKFEARTCRSTYLVFLAFLGPLFILGLVASLKSQAWEGFWIYIGAVSLVVAWITSYKLSIDDHELSYRTLFAGTRSITLSEIAKAEAKVGVKDSFGPMYRLTVYSLKGPDSRPIVINLKVFSREDLKQLFHLLGDRIK